MGIKTDPQPDPLDPSRYPLGVPINREEPPRAFPIEGRPGWFKDRFTGREFFVDTLAPSKGPGT